jgi:hypothetical protein
MVNGEWWMILLDSVSLGYVWDQLGRTVLLL